MHTPRLPNQCCDSPRPRLTFRDMGVIDVRRFKVATTCGPGGDLEVADVWLADEDAWDIDLAEVVKVNGLAVPADRKLTYRVIQHELRLLLSFLVDQPGSPLTLRHTEFRASSLHVKRFISESFGLGMLTAAAEHHHRWVLSDGDLYSWPLSTQVPVFGQTYSSTSPAKSTRSGWRARRAAGHRPVQRPPGAAAVWVPPVVGGGRAWDRGVVESAGDPGHALPGRRCANIHATVRDVWGRAPAGRPAGPCSVGPVGVRPGVG